MIYSCGECHFIFMSEDNTKQCPDCGKYKVRPATEDEKEEFKKRKSEEM